MSINRDVDADRSSDMPFQRGYRILFPFEGLVLVIGVSGNRHSVDQQLKRDAMARLALHREWDSWPHDNILGAVARRFLVVSNIGGTCDYRRCCPRGKRITGPIRWADRMAACACNTWSGEKGAGIVYLN